MNSKIESLVIATRNPAKEARYRALLSQYACRICTLNDLMIHGRPDELGETAEANAEMKAAFYARETGMVAFSEDEALYVDFLPREKQPGVHVRRVNGQDEASDEHLFAYWEEIIAQVALADRKGRWHVACCLADSGGRAKTIAVDLPIRFYSPPSPIKIPGWPMSSLEGPADFNKPHSELSAAEKRQAGAKIDQALAKALQEMFDPAI